MMSFIYKQFFFPIAPLTFTLEGCSSDQCTSNAVNVLPSCLNESPLPVFIQLGHLMSSLFFIKLKWNLLPGQF